jgi:fructan beta-fructosidase
MPGTAKNLAFPDRTPKNMQQKISSCPSPRRRGALLKRTSLLASAVFAFSLAGPHTARAQVQPTYQEPFRPQFHFTPAKNWINDPNGLVDYKGEHHMFYQYNPFGNVWDFTISWGHAVSTDFVHWKELPVAIPATNTVSIFSGSAVVDKNNSSGFGTPGNPPLIAIYAVYYRTASIDPNDSSVIPLGTQAQDIAFSTDRGRTWTPYAKNPVINPNKDSSIIFTDFRDPKVFWYEATQQWIMAVALSAQHKIRFYSSTDLKNWTKLSDFGPANAVGGVWECPDLFELPVGGGSDHEQSVQSRGGDQWKKSSKNKWVLVVNVNPGAVAGGSGAQYFLGQFDGKQFTAEDIIDPTVPPPGTVFQNFEGSTTFAGLGWTPTGDFVDKGPATGNLPSQGGVSGFLGKQLANTFFQVVLPNGTLSGGDFSEGTITSPTFTVNKKYINLLVGGGNHPHDPNATDAPEPAGVLLFPHADLEPPNPGVTTYEQLGWTSTGGLVNQPVATGAIGGQQPVSGFEGIGLINTFTNGNDQAQGTLTSPVFTISKAYINFLIGGGNHPYPGNNDATAVLLLVNGKVVLSATGQNNETLNWVSWNVSQFIGQQAQIEVVDENSGGFGHINADGFLAADSPAHPRSTETTVNLVVGGNIVRSATGHNSEQLYWSAWNVADFAGQNAQVEIIDENNGGFGHILVDDIYFSDVPKEQANWIDRGRDFYAVNSWNNLPNNERRWIAWMNNWDYGTSIPTSPWRSAQSIPRDVRLETVDDNVQLVQKPIPELRELRQSESNNENMLINAGTSALSTKGKALEIVAEFKVGTASQFGLKVRTGSGEETLVGYDAPAGEVFVDRTNSGQVSFSNLFPGRQTAPLPAENGRVKLHIFVDWSSVEVFGGDGQTVITDQIFPMPSSDGLALFANGGTAKLVSLRTWQLRSIWDSQ